MPQFSVAVGKACVVACLLWQTAACSTVQVRTTPPDADVEADGAPLEDGEFSEGLGFQDHTVTVHKEGYAPSQVKVPRDRMIPWLKWTMLTSALGCAVCSSFLCANAGLVLCNPSVPGRFLGYAFGSFVVGGCGSNLTEQLVLYLFEVAVVTSLSPNILTIPAMGLLGLVGAWPLVGLLVPLLFPRAAPEVHVVLKPVETTPTSTTQDPRDAAPSKAKGKPAQ